MRSWLGKMMILIALLVMCSIDVSAETLSGTDKGFTCKITDGKACVTGMTSTVGETVVIPSTLCGYPVTGIGERAFWQCENLKEVTIPSGVEYIGGEAFGYTSLTAVDLPDGVKSIGYGAFWCCDDLRYIYIPSSVEYIGAFVFEKCDELVDLIIPSSVKEIGSCILEGCTSIRFISIPFFGFDKDEAQTAKCAYLFSAIEDFESVPASLKYVELTNTEYVSDFAFAGCHYIQEVTLPEGLKSIGERAFNSCVAMETLVLPQSVTTIGKEAFKLCNFTSINLPSSVKTIGDKAFYGCDELDEYYYCGTEAQWNAIEFGTENEALTSLERKDHKWGEWEADGEYQYRYCVFCNSQSAPMSDTGYSIQYRCRAKKYIVSQEKLSAPWILYDTNERHAGMRTAIADFDDSEEMSAKYAACIHKEEMVNKYLYNPYPSPTQPGTYWYGTEKEFQEVKDGDWIHWIDDGELHYRYTYCTSREIDYYYYKWSEWTDWGDTVYTPDEDTEVEVRKVYAVTFHANGGKNTPEKQYKLLDEDFVVSSVSPTRDGYAFMGWSTSPTGTVEYAEGDVYAVNENVTLYAVWKSVHEFDRVRTYYRYRVKETTESTEILDAPWILYDTELKEKHTGFEYITKPADYSGMENSYCIHDKIYTLRYVNKNNAGQWFYATPSEFMNMGGTVVLTYSPAEAYYRYKYCTSKTPYYVYHYYSWGEWSEWSETPIAATANVEVETKSVALFTITYDANGGSDAPAQQFKEYGERVNLSTEIPTRENHQFLGWRTTAEGRVEYASGGEYSVNANITLYAVWKDINGYTVTYDANGGSGAPETVTKEYDEVITLSQIIPTRENHQFLGWSTSADGDVEYVAGEEYSENAHVTLYAVWKNVTEYTVTYDANGGTGAPTQQKKIHGEVLMIGREVPAKEGCSFLGWSTTSSGEIEYAVGSTYENDESVTLYAVWVWNEYIVSYDANGGTGAPEHQLKIHSEDLILSKTKPDRDGFAFLGWSTEKDGDVEYFSGDTYSLNGTVVLYAVWEEDGEVLASGVCGRALNWTLYSNGNLVVDGTGDMYNYEYDDYRGKGTSPWYMWRSSIKSVVIKDGVTSVGKYAFYWYHDSLEKVKIAGSVVRIGDYSFGRCYSLTDLTIAEGVVEIGQESFAQCEFTTLTIPNSVTTIDYSAFYFCNDLTDLSLGKGIQFIGNNAFYLCTRLENVWCSGGYDDYPKSVLNSNIFRTATWHYDNCLWVYREQTHTYSDFDFVITMQPMHGVPGVKTYTCGDCGTTRDEEIPALTYHTYGDWIKHNEARHKKSCTCGDVIFAYHTWNISEVTTQPTHVATGIKTYTCSDCGTTRNAEIPMLPHVYGDWMTYDDVQHKKSCECGDIVYADHGWDAGVITTEPTHTTLGVKTFTCIDCEATKTEDVSKLSEHVYGNWLKTDCGWHKKVCVCGDAIREDHDWDDGAVTKKPTHTSTGIMTYTCVVCNAKETLTIVKQPHVFGEWLSISETQHTKTCECGAVETESHNWDEGIVTIQPTQTTYGERTYTCADCAATKAETIYTYAITYDANGGMDVPASQTKIQGETLILSDVKPTRAGYTFRGWATTAAGAVTYVPGTSYTTNAALMLYAVWEINTYTILYDANGGAGAPKAQTKIYGTELTLSKTSPKREGHMFQGWATEPEGAVVYVPGASYTANAAATLYAVWEANTYTVAYDANGGTGAPASQTKTHGIVLKLSDAVPARADYTFQGWSTSITGKTQRVIPASGMESEHNYASNTNKTWVVSCSDAKSISLTFDARTSLEAGYDFLYLYNGNGIQVGKYSGTELAGQTITVQGDTVKLKLTSDYTFNEWGFKVTSAIATIAPYTPGVDYAVDGDVTLYAVWEINTYTIRYDANGGTGVPKAQTKIHGTQLTLSEASPNREGYTFQGWATTSGGAVAYVPGASYTANAAATLYAVWEANTYTVTYDANGGEGAPLEQIKIHGTALTLSSIVPTRTGYTFKGWVTRSAGVMQEVLSVSGLESEHDYASNTNKTWVVSCSDAKSISLTFDSRTEFETRYDFLRVYDGGDKLVGTYSGTTLAGQTITVQGDTVKLKLTSDGVFNRWGFKVASAIATIAPYTPGADYAVDGDVTLYAVWEVSTYTIRYDANGGTGAPASQTKTYGTELTLASKEPTRTGYTFQGWATSTTGAVVYAPGADYTANKAVTLYAVWEAINYTISVGTVQNGIVLVSSETGIIGDRITVTADPDDLYELAEIMVDGVAIQGNTFTVSGNHNVSAVFREVVTVQAQMSVTGTDSVVLDISTSKAARAAVAFYDGNGRMLDVRLLEVPMGASEHMLTKLLTNPSEAGCKIIFLDSDGKPMCKAIEL